MRSSELADASPPSCTDRPDGSVTRVPYVSVVTYGTRSSASRREPAACACAAASTISAFTRSTSAAASASASAGVPVYTADELSVVRWCGARLDTARSI